MRCQKVRSYLSAYCNGELEGRRKISIDEHLSECADCRKEEAVYLSINKATQKIGEFKVSSDFNNQLLNRIANERFAETRSNAYMPKEAPLFAWNKLVPAVASAALVLLVAVTVFMGSPDNPINSTEYAAGNGNDMNAELMNAQPINNPNMTINAGKNWSFGNQMARSERISNISNNISPTATFSSSHNGMVNTSSGQQAPFSTTYYRIRPVIKVYITSPSSTTGEATRIY